MFQMRLLGRVPSQRFDQEMLDVDPVLDDYRSILSHVCRLLEETSAITFLVQGFGEERWRVDVATDLMVVLEQLPALFMWVDDARVDTFQLDFYEQGVERVLTFSSLASDMIRVDGAPLLEGASAWHPIMSSETIARAELRSQILLLTRTFLEMADLVCPAASGHPWLAAHFAPVRSASRGPCEE
jgi:hypothetical protein